MQCRHLLQIKSQNQIQSDKTKLKAAASFRYVACNKCNVHVLRKITHQFQIRVFVLAQDLKSITRFACI